MYPVEKIRQRSAVPFHSEVVNKYSRRQSLALLSLCLFGAVYAARICGLVSRSGSLTSIAPSCRAPLPPLLTSDPPNSDHPALVHASKALDKALARRLTDDSLDSVSIAIVTAEGSVYERGLGPLRANETEPGKRGTVDRNSIYRLASISKMLTMVETLVLQQRGVLQIDDPVTRFFPNFTYIPHGHDATHNLREPEPITLRQLASHMSGIARDIPAGEATGWPGESDGSGPPPANGLPFPTLEMAMESIAGNPLVAPQYTYPIYSNTGWSLLGACNVAANALFSKDAVSTHAELLQRDVLDPVGMNGTSFLVTETGRKHMAVGSVHSNETDDDFLDWSNPAGGQMSSLSDLVKLMQTFIDPTRPESVLSPYTVREWLRPIHAWWDDVSEVGVMWEIMKIKDSTGRTQGLYQKYGNLAGYHSVFAVNSASSFGIVALTTGSTSHTMQITQDAVAYFQPAFDQILVEKAKSSFAGTWTSTSYSGSSEAIVVLESGSLWVTKLILEGKDALRALRGLPERGETAGKLGLWWTGGEEFRLVGDYAGFEGNCFGQWALLDSVGRYNGYPVNLVRFSGSGTGRVLSVPSLNIMLSRPEERGDTKSLPWSSRLRDRIGC